MSKGQSKGQIFENMIFTKWSLEIVQLSHCHGILTGKFFMILCL